MSSDDFEKTFTQYKYSVFIGSAEKFPQIRIRLENHSLQYKEFFRFHLVCELYWLCLQVCRTPTVQVLYCLSKIVDSQMFLDQEQSKSVQMFLLLLFHKIFFKNG